ncbi:MULTISPECIES: pyridoxamine 5'-phosphate oxidase [unclassified Novosphingobium]|uniref:pyridoxamine 5'-phosphate oxidase n=1 Tax=unclassified Novosphingobium TaxID=2644732 RepID=UPI00020EE69A|nr:MULTISPECIES: pyridoxamine 5'-phosphate oxidase [unclassified Novosphingobium]GFM30397.1 pyridoxamine 5'-phosphate oxidase [Novosphingobium sp. PY1]CCA91033.1 pyridoxamine 5'-phosphate oxidase [Novosphingobium sp. PP1Y]
MEAEQAREVIPHGDPFALFTAWYDEAREAEPNDSNAMALATATPEGLPSVRMVLLKGYGPDGFVFYTNGHSRKGQEIAANPNVALLFHWKSLRRQIRIEGRLQPVSDAEADAYFHSRARDSQLGAVASDQSAPLDSRETFLARYEAARDRFAHGEVDRPPHWGGFRVVPSAIEFWHDRPYRLHERRRFVRKVTTDGHASAWSSTLLYP